MRTLYPHLSDDQLLASYEAAVRDYRSDRRDHKLMDQLWFALVERGLKEEGEAIYYGRQRRQDVRR